MSSAAEQAYAAIRACIVDGRHAPGTMLSENDLAASLHMSRTPIRSAITRLSDEGWLRVYPKRGVLVLGIDASEARDLTRALQAFEVTGLRDASPEALATTVACLRDELVRQSQAVRRGDVESLLASSARFHRAMASAAGNTVLQSLYDRLDDRRALLSRASATTMLERGDVLIAEHEQLIDLAESGEWEAFIGVLRSHVNETHAEALA